MNRLALKFAYSGKYFHGFQRQPDVRTIEGDIREALFELEGMGLELDRDGKQFELYRDEKKFEPDRGGKEFEPYVREKKEPIYSYASRTDSGVSAAGNVILFSTPLSGKDLIGYLNTKLEHIFFHSFAEVNERFNPRFASERWYRYFVPTFTRNGNEPCVEHCGRIWQFDVELAREAAAIIAGTHDFSIFSKLAPGRDPIRNLNSIDIRIEKKATGLPPFLVFDLRGESFLWMMVKYIVGALLTVGTGQKPITWISKLLDGEENMQNSEKKSRQKPVPAPPEPLVLMDVIYPNISFKKVAEPQRYYVSMAGGQMADMNLWEQLLD